MNRSNKTNVDLTCCAIELAWKIWKECIFTERTYTDVFYIYRISFCFNVYVYISVPIYVFILIMNPSFNRYILCIKLDVLFCYALSEMTK